MNYGGSNCWISWRIAKMRCTGTTNVFRTTKMVCLKSEIICTPWLSFHVVDLNQEQLDNDFSDDQQTWRCWFQWGEILDIWRKHPNCRQTQLNWELLQRCSWQHRLCNVLERWVYVIQDLPQSLFWVRVLQLTSLQIPSSYLNLTNVLDKRKSKLMMSNGFIGNQ